jgi:hypothetical protein
MQNIIDDKLDLINDIIKYHVEVFLEEDFDEFRKENLIDSSTDSWNIKSLFNNLTVKQLTSLIMKLNRY